MLWDKSGSIPMPLSERHAGELLGEELLDEVHGLSDDCYFTVSKEEDTLVWKVDYQLLMNMVSTFNAKQEL